MTTVYGIWQPARACWMMNASDMSIVHDTRPGLLFARIMNGLNKEYPGVRVAVIPERGGEPTEFVEPACATTTPFVSHSNMG